MFKLNSLYEILGKGVLEYDNCTLAKFEHYITNTMKMLNVQVKFQWKCELVTRIHI